VGVWFGKSRVEAEMDAEMRLHLDLEIEDNVRAGMDPAAARRLALVRFGGVERFKEEARMTRGGRVVEDFFKDVRLALRGLRRSPGFTIVALAMLALGIGANTAIFSVIHAVMLRPLPFPEPDRLVQVYEVHMAQGWDHFSFSEPNLLDLMESAQGFESVAGITSESMNLTGDGAAERVGVTLVTPGFFNTLGVGPLLGRTFFATDVPGEDPHRVTLLSQETWTTRFGSDPGVIGRTVQLDGNAFEIVGVLPTMGIDFNEDFVVPFGLRADAMRDNHFIAAIARLRPGTSIEAAQSELSPLASRVVEQSGAEDAGMDLIIEPSSRWAGDDDLRRSLWVFMGAVGFLLLIACMNLANLLLARVAARRRQVAMCVALGARRGRIVRQLLTEAAVLGLAGAALGIGVAHLGLRALMALEPGNIPRLDDVQINGWVLAFTLMLALATSVLGGLLPALRLPVRSLGTALRDGGRSQSGGRSQARLRGWLVSAETALSLVLLVGAGLLVRSLLAVQTVDAGFDSEDRITFEVNLPNSFNRGEQYQFRDEFLTRVREMPAVTSAAAVNIRPVSPGSTVTSMVPEGETVETFGGAVSAHWRLISEDYFQTMGLDLVQGQDLTHVPPNPDDGGLGGEVDIVISESLAQALWPGKDPLGERALLWVSPDRVGTVIGVVEDMRERGPGQDETLAVYFPYNRGGWSPVHFVVHTRGEPRAILPTVRSIVSDIDASLPLSRVLTMDDLMQDSTASRRFTMILLTVFAGVALVLALAGVYGVVSDSVNQRSQELGVRVAMGASSGQVLGLVIRQGMMPTVLGLAVGVVAAF